MPQNSLMTFSLLQITYLQLLILNQLSHWVVSYLLQVTTGNSISYWPSPCPSFNIDSSPVFVHEGVLNGGDSLSKSSIWRPSWLSLVDESENHPIWSLYVQGCQWTKANALKWHTAVLSSSIAFQSCSVSPFWIVLYKSSPSSFPIEIMSCLHCLP